MATTFDSTVIAHVKKEAARGSWIWFVTGVLWILVSVTILQFDQASAATVGVIAGAMFVAAGVQTLFFGAVAPRSSWFWYLFGWLLVVGGGIALLYPTRTFFAMASILGFVFVANGTMWVFEAFLTRRHNALWWFNLIAGILTIALGFWLSGQFLVTQAAALLVFAGVWAIMRGILDIMIYFALRTVADADPAGR